MSKIDQLITEQVLSWSRSEYGDRREKDHPGSWPVITISREFGAGGRTLAHELGKRLDFKVWDKELLTAVADEADADERLLTSLDERRRKMIDDLVIGSLMGAKHSNTHYWRSLLRVVHTIAAHGKSILVGRGSHYIIKSKDILRVRLVRPFEERAAHVAEREGIPIKEAEKLTRIREAEREDFIQHYFKRDATAPCDYDLVLNSGEYDIDQLADIVMVAYEKKTGKAVQMVA